MRRASIAALAFVLLNGCARAPAVDVLGSFFPIWIFCILAGIVFTVIAYQVAVRVSPDVDYGSPVVIYPSLVVLFACLTWLVFFR
jgi:hypothetical protein